MKNSAIRSCKGLFVVLMLAAFVVRAEAQAKAETALAQTKDSQTTTEAAPQSQAEGTEAQTKEDPKLKSVQGSKALGMSILGNQEAPTALVIVPWKTSELGKSVGVSTMLDDSKQPIDKAVFMRMLSYYEIRSDTGQAGSASTKSNAAQAASALNRRNQ